jgi:copper(I)-binding protein
MRKETAWNSRSAPLRGGWARVLAAGSGVFLVFAISTHPVLAAQGSGNGGPAVEIIELMAPPTRQVPVGVVYMTIRNLTDRPERLLGAKTPVALQAQLHQSKKDGDMMKMARYKGGFLIPARDQTELKPGGKHLMLMGLVKQFEAGQSFELILNFEHAGKVNVSVPVHELSLE